MRLWRISGYADLSGIGGLIASGRWHSKGRRVVYLSESSALAILEALVHLELDVVPAPFQLLRINAPDKLKFASWPVSRDAFDQRKTRRWGSDWLDGKSSALARVPSVIAPAESNWLLNPLHHDAAQVTLEESSFQPWDKRLFAR